MKRTFGILIVLLLSLSLVLAGCGSSQSAGSQSSNTSKSSGDTQATTAKSTTASSSSNKPATVSLSGWTGNTNEQKNLKKVVNDFEKKYPNIHVKMDMISSQYMDVLTTRLVGGTGPDVFYMDVSEMDKMIPKGVMEPLDSYIQKTPNFNLDDFSKPLLTAFQKDGKTYGIPKDFNTLSLFMNVDAFKKAGLVDDKGNPIPPKTWAELAADAKKLTTGKQIGLNINADIARLIPNMMAYGGKVVDDKGMPVFATDAVAKGLNDYFDLYRKGYAKQASDVGAGWEGEGFGKGDFAMMISGSWCIGYLQSTFPAVKYTVAELPTENGKKNTMAYTVAYVMNKASKNKEAAWKLLSYLTGKEGMKAWSEGGVALPSRLSLQGEFKTDPKRAPFFAGAAYATPWRIGSYQSTIATSFNNEITAVLMKKEDLMKDLKKAQDNATKEIKAAQ